jgi:transposase
MTTPRLLIDLGDSTAAPPASPRVDALVQRPQRHQVELGVFTLDNRVPVDHSVREIDAVIAGLDLTMLDAKIRSNAEAGGRPAIDPRILLTLWVYGTTQGEVEASEIARRTQTDDIYRWICGGVSVGERKLADFRAKGAEVFDAMLTQVIVALMSEGLIDLHRTAQDGTRVRTWTGADSFRRQDTLETLLAETRAHLAALQARADDGGRSKVARVAQERGARQRVERLERAVARVRTLAAELTEAERKDPKKAPRVSATDPEATRMKMSDGGFRPAFNVQFDTTADGQGAVVGVSVSNRGYDYGEMTPMQAQVEQRSGQRPNQKLVDGGYVKKEDIREVEQSGTQVFAPMPKRSAAPGSRSEVERSAEEKAFYERIQSAEGKAVYHQRGEVAELTNAHAKSRYGLVLLMLRGLKGALVMALLAALTKDVQVLVRARAARAQRAAITAVAIVA